MKRFTGSLPVLDFSQPRDPRAAHFVEQLARTMAGARLDRSAQGTTCRASDPRDGRPLWARQTRPAKAELLRDPARHVVAAYRFQAGVVVYARQVRPLAELDEKVSEPAGGKRALYFVSPARGLLALRPLAEKLFRAKSGAPSGCCRLCGSGAARRKSGRRL